MQCKRQRRIIKICIDSKTTRTLFKLRQIATFGINNEIPRIFIT